jgi:hypothetical protein
VFVRLEPTVVLDEAPKKKMNIDALANPDALEHFRSLDELAS